MTNKLLLSLLFLASLSEAVYAQSDSTMRKYQSGFAVYAEFGLLSNSSFKSIRNDMKALQIKPFEPLMASIVLAKRMETEKFFVESRLILMNSTKYSKDDNVRKGTFGGIGIGVDASPKFVNTRHWNVMVPLGYDLMLYQLRVKNNQTATLGQLVNNPASYQAVRLHTGNINLHGGVGVDYKMYLFPKVYEKVYISTKFSYHLPVLGKKQWRGDDLTVTDLHAFKPNQLYWQIGLVFFPKASRMHHMWKGMH